MFKVVSPRHACLLIHTHTQDSAVVMRGGERRRRDRDEIEEEIEKVPPLPLPSQPKPCSHAMPCQVCLQKVDMKVPAHNRHSMCQKVTHCHFQKVFSSCKMFLVLHSHKKLGITLLSQRKSHIHNAFFFYVSHTLPSHFVVCQPGVSLFSVSLSWY